MDFDKLRKKHSADELRDAYREGRLSLKVVNATDPTAEPRPFPEKLRQHYALNVEQGSVTTTGNPPSGPKIGPLAFLITEASWPDRLAEQSAVNWFKALVTKCGDAKPEARDDLARQAVEKFAISQRRFIEIAWEPFAPVTWKKPGAPSK